MKLLSIERKQNILLIVFEHVLKSIFGFLAIYCLTIFGPSIIGRRSSSTELASEIFNYLVDHPLLHIGLGVMGAIGYNIYTLYHKKQKCYAVEVKLSKGMLTIGLTDLYWGAVDYKTIPVSNVRCEVDSNPWNMFEGGKKLNFIDHNNRVIARILPKHWIWHNDKYEVYACVNKLKELCLTHNT